MSAFSLRFFFFCCVCFGADRKVKFNDRRVLMALNSLGTTLARRRRGKLLPHCRIEQKKKRRRRRRCGGKVLCKLQVSVLPRQPSPPLSLPPRGRCLWPGRTLSRAETSRTESVQRSVREISIIRHYVLCSVYLHASLGLGYSSRSDQRRGQRGRVRRGWVIEAGDDQNGPR